MSGDLQAAQVNRSLWLLTLFYLLCFLDRQVLAILAEPIRRELGLSDTQVGLMAGLAFAVLYTVGGIPLARHADNPRSDRVRLICWCLAIWSGFTMLCGMAQTFIQLLLARVGVGIGEAGCTPAAHALIGDVVPLERRSAAMARYGLGQPVGGLLGMVIGGVIAHRYGWRASFFVVGAPGLLLALVASRLIAEPRRAAIGATASPAAAPAMPFRAAVREVFASRAFAHMLVAGAVVAFLAYGLSVWTATFFMRTHGLNPAQVGVWLGLSSGIAGIAGTLAGGRLADRFGARDPRHQLTPAVVALALSVPVQFAAVRMADWRAAMVLMMIPTFCLAMAYGPAWGLTQTLVPRRARAMAAAIKLFVQALVGIGFGPLLFGVASDLLRPFAGDASVRWVLQGATLLLLIPAFSYWRASLLLGGELDRGRERQTI